MLKHSTHLHVVVSCNFLLSSRVVKKSVIREFLQGSAFDLQYLVYESFQV